MQLVFGRDAIINTKFIADSDYIHQRKQNIIQNNNERENAKRIPHTYQIGDRIMLRKYNQHKYGGPEYEAHTQSQRLMITVLYVSNGVSFMTSSTSEISSLTVLPVYSTYPDHGGECNIRSDDSVSIRRLSQSYVSNNTFQGIVEVFTQIR